MSEFYIASYSLDSDQDICHYGVKGMHWGIRRYQPYNKSYTGKGRFVGTVKNMSEGIPWVETKSGYVYPKGSTFGHFGKNGNYDLTDKEPLWCYTNKKDYNYYKEGWGGSDEKDNTLYRLKKNLKVPDLVTQIDEAISFFNADEKTVWEAPIDYWKDFMEPKVDKMADFMKYMEEKGYDVLQDIYDLNKAMNPVIVLNPVESLEVIRSRSNDTVKHYESEGYKLNDEFIISSYSLYNNEIYHYGRPGMKWGQHIFGKENRSNKRLRKETKKSLKRLRALEENVRNKNAIRQPARENVTRAEAALEENIKKYGKGKLFESKASKERRMQAIKTAEYNVERNRELANKAERLFEVASEAYKKEAKNVERLVNEAIKAVGEENVRNIKYQKEAKDFVFKFIDTGVSLPSANKQAKIILEAEKEYRDRPNYEQVASKIDPELTDKIFDFDKPLGMKWNTPNKRKGG